MKLKNNILRSFLPLLFLLSSTISSLQAQTIRVNDILDAESSFSPEELISDVLVGGNCANISNISSVVNGNPTDTTTKSYGYFKRLPGSTFPFEEGIVLTTGNAFNTSNGGSQLDDPSTGLSDADLNQIIDPNTVFTDATVFEFDFTSSSDTINFRYIMASEEYDEEFPCFYSDSFAFLLKVAGTTTYENIAIIPETTTPVSVTSVHPGVDLFGNGIGCGPQNEDYFEGYNLGDTNFNGRTTILNATATVIPNKTYHIKLVIADANNGQPGIGPDSTYDSAVFLEAGSFNLGFDLGDDFLIANNTAVCGNELTLTANTVATSYQWLKDGAILPGAINQTYVANLGNGIYTCEITDANNCTGSDDVILEFVDAPTINPLIPVFQLCDADGNLTENFNLTIKENEILNGQDPVNFEVQYFSDVDYTNPIVDPIGYNNTNIIETIYVRVTNRDSSNCYIDGSFIIQITSLPIPTDPSDYRLCDDTFSIGGDTDGVSSFLLNTKDAEILTGVTNPGNYTISYYTDPDGAVDSDPTFLIPKDIDYLVTNSQRVYVRIENIANADCNAISDDSASSTFKSFELIVDPLPVISSPVELKQCDDDTDGFSFFNLNEAASDISTNYLNETFVFYPRLLDADNGTNAYTPAEALAFRNRTVTTDTVWARAISGFGCYRIAEVNLVVSTTGLPTTFQRSFTLCDDFLDIDGIDTINNDDTDGVTAFNFSSVTAEVRALFPASQQLTITYYRNQANALAEVDAITDTANYRNIGYPNTQQIYIRVDSDLDNDCLGFGPFITLTVDPVPTADPVTNLILCDNGDDGDFINGIVQTFNLESQTPIILGTQDPLNFTVTYHTSDTDALSGANQIINTTMYENIIPNLETIYVRVANNTTGCFTNHTSFDLIVNELPIANFVD
ncbi:choice-of-anchor L domain-containing protein, partial [bacterium]|nr:choice-of-anchor L domain-containing protein [bacterium]